MSDFGHFETMNQADADAGDIRIVSFTTGSAADLVVELASAGRVSITSSTKTIVLPLTAFSSPPIFADGSRLTLNQTGITHTAQGGTGNDYLIGDLVSGDTADTLSGGAGNDVLQGGTGSDWLTGGPGDDIFRFVGGDSGLFSPTGKNRSGEADVITDFDVAHDQLQFSLEGGSSSNFRIISAGGTDPASIEQAANNAFSGNRALRYVAIQHGNDANIFFSDADGGEAHGLVVLQNLSLTTFTSDKILAGPALPAAVNQQISGYEADFINQYLAGGAGDDTLSSGGGTSVYATGGAGADVFKLSRPQDFMIVTDFQPGQDHLDLGLGPATASNFARAGSAPDTTASDTIAKAAFVNNPNLVYVAVDIAATSQTPASTKVYGHGSMGSTDGPKLLLKWASAQELNPTDFTGSGTASPPASSGLNLVGGAGADTLEGGSGNDTIDGGDGNNVLHGNDGNDVITGGSGFDDINGNKGNDTIHAGAGDDWVSGGQNDDQVYGDDGHDLVYGNLGNDTVYGGNGDDWIRGGQGNDIVDGGAGNDLIWGDRGDDTLTGGAGADQFHTFAGAGVDRVTDFNGVDGDRIVIDDRTAYTVAASGSDTVITLATGDTMILQGVSATSFHTDWIMTAG